MFVGNFALVVLARRRLEHLVLAVVFGVIQNSFRVLRRALLDVGDSAIWVEQHQLVNFDREGKRGSLLDLLVGKILEDLLKRSLGYRVFRDVDICLLVFDKAK